MTLQETLQEIQDRMETCPWREHPQGNPYVCTRYFGTTVICNGACGWVVDYMNLKEHKTQKGGEE